MSCFRAFLCREIGGNGHLQTPGGTRNEELGKNTLHKRKWLGVESTTRDDKTEIPVNIGLMDRPWPRNITAELRDYSESMRKKEVPLEALARTLQLAICLCVMPKCGPGQIIGAVCNEGAGRFATRFTTGVIVTVGPQRDQGFATRACEASLVQNGNEVVAARSAAQVDIDVFGADMGLGMPVVAFHIEQSESDSGTAYKVYSLRGQPRLLRTLTKGDSYRAADTDLDGRIEIWTRDAITVNHFEDIPLSEFEVPPTIVLRFENQHLVDVSSQFQPYYDRQIAQLRAQFDSRLLSKFKDCDGRLSVIPPEELNDLLGLTSTKIKVLEIVWAYLYSGREQDAWRTLADLWPASDLDRIRKTIESARAGGIRSEIDVEFSPPPPPRKKEQVHVYELALITKVINSNALLPGRTYQDGFDETSEAPKSLFRDITMPVPIFLDTPSPTDSEHPFPRPGVLLDLIIDAAGKVSSARIVNKDDNGPIGEALINASSHWKFIPAMKNRQSVASHIQLTVSPYR